MVDGLGRVAHQDGDVVGLLGAVGEAGRAVPGRLVVGRGPSRLVARPTVHARIPGQEFGDPVRHHLEGGGRGAAIEVAVGALGPVEAGHGEMGADQGGDARPLESRPTG